jgi:tetratricopeptide (TPR) repeat protein
VTQFEAALKTFPQDATLHYDLGLALKLKDKLIEATAEFRTAEELDPQQSDVHYTLGVTLWQQGDFPAAADELHAALRTRPDYAEAWYTLGTVLKQQGKIDESASALREAIRLQPDFAGAHTTLAAVLRQLGDNQGAAAESKAGIEISKEKTDQQAALFATNSGKRLLNAGDLDGAISQFRSAITATPGYAPAHFQLALALERKGDKEQAAEEFQKAAQLDSRLTRSSP